MKRTGTIKLVKKMKHNDKIFKTSNQVKKTPMKSGKGDFSKTKINSKNK